ncbi:MAG: hypothetical protein K8I04_11085 [Gammaproteobacteria bacterium]|nr:hypothetical protein [Gammaproteobacteria bacterium]
MHDTQQELEGLQLTAEALASVIEAAERLAANTDPMLARLLAHARALADELTNGLDIEAERLSTAA